jgi:hypothetical protein
MKIGMTRREFAALAGAAMLVSPASAQTGELISRAMRGPLPDADQRRRLAEFVASL